MIARLVLAALIMFSFSILFVVALCGLAASSIGLDTTPLWASFGVLAIAQALALYWLRRIDRRYG